MRLNHLSPLSAVVLVAIVGCSKPEVDFTRIAIGMTKDQVIEKFGKPTRVSVISNMEIFEYEAYDAHNRPFVGVVRDNYRRRFVRFYGGKVESFGNKGDFDSTKNPTTEQKIDLKVTGGATAGASSSHSPEKFDLAAELKKLDQMKKEGLLTEDEYKGLRQRAIDKAKAQ